MARDNQDGTLTYSFVESVQAMHPYYIVRFLGGAFFLCGMLVMAYNLYRPSQVRNRRRRHPAPAAAIKETDMAQDTRKSKKTSA